MNVWITFPSPLVFWFVGWFVGFFMLSHECMNKWKNKRSQKNVNYQGMLRWTEIWPTWKSSVASRCISTKSPRPETLEPKTCVSYTNTVTSYVTSRFNKSGFLWVIYKLHQIILLPVMPCGKHLMAAGTSGSVLLCICVAGYFCCCSGKLRS
jgi:hypothetical protein